MYQATVTVVSPGRQGQILTHRDGLHVSAPTFIFNELNPLWTAPSNNMKCERIFT